MERTETKEVHMAKSYTVFVLRGQPFQKAHKQIIQNSLEISDEVIIAIGSHRAPITIKNPWRYEFRADLIRGSMTAEENARIKIVPLRDFLYSMNTWVTALQNAVSSLIEPDSTVSLTGHYKDDSSFYLDFFPQWKLIPQPNFKVNGKNVDATTVRKLLFEEKPEWKEFVPDYVVQKLEEYSKTEDFQKMKREFEFITKYKKRWEGSPYPPTFVTVDAVVIQSGHVLLIRRGKEPGKGYFGLPGGFLNTNETIRQGILRELKEETKIGVPSIILEKSIKTTHVFDHPYRSLRGRVITHAALIELDFNKPLPFVEGSDDADKALWMPFNDIYLKEEIFFDDHIHILGFFLNNKLYNI